MKKKVYLTLCILGIISPMSLFIPWFIEHGFDFSTFIAEIIHFPISAAGWADLVVAAIVFMFFICFEGKRIGMTKLWVPMTATWCIGLSFGLPLFLLMREIHLERNTQYSGTVVNNA